ncbi:hypothetical protein AALO_G00229490 [Alosa alosa]|uniref:Uncharacterized protein n=1 Tax=Alosa alosa TaxID=278164 RepID=A0AAV6FUR2_9TELE|nr:hypothetical protein AALO_G00229490 [Alosa alosa]
MRNIPRQNSLEGRGRAGRTNSRKVAKSTSFPERCRPAETAKKRPDCVAQSSTPSFKCLIKCAIRSKAVEARVGLVTRVRRRERRRAAEVRVSSEKELMIPAGK